MWARDELRPDAPLNDEAFYVAKGYDKSDIII